jgi:excisionase family DNA binding protein
MPDNPISSIPRLTFTVNEAAGSLGVTSRFLWGKIYEGKIPVARVGGRVLIRVEDLQALLERSVDTSGKPAFHRTRKAAALTTLDDIPRARA